MQKLTNRMLIVVVTSLFTACGGGGGSTGNESSTAATQSQATSSAVTIQAADLSLDTTNFTVINALSATQLESVRTNDIAANDSLIVTMEEDLRGAQNLNSGLFFRLRIIDATNFNEVGSLDKILSVVRMNFGDDGDLYIDTTGQGLVRVDVNDPGSPRIVDQVQTSWGSLESLVQGNVLYQASYNHGLFAFDIADRNKPRLLDEINFDDAPQIRDINRERQDRGLNFDIKTQARALDIIGSTLFVATRDGGLFLVDVSNPSQLTVSGHYLVQSIWDVAVGSDVAYVTVGDGLEILDVKDMTQPKRLALVGLPGNSSRVTINQNIAVVALDLDFEEIFITQNGQQVRKKGAIMYHDLTTPLTAANFKLIYFDDAVEEAIYKDGAIFVVTKPAIYKLSN